MPKVSLILPLYAPHPDLIKLTQDCISSLFHHTPKIFELIVVDATPKYPIENWASEQKFSMPIKYVKLDKNYWYAYMSNRGFAVADPNSDYIMVLNNDFVFVGGWLEPLVETMEKHPVMGIAGPVLCWGNMRPNSTGRNILPNYQTKSVWFDERWIKAGILLPCTYVLAPFVRRKALNQINMKTIFHSRYINAREEVDLALRMWEGHRDVCLVTSSKIIHRVSKTYKYLPELRNAVEIAKKHGVRAVDRNDFNARFSPALLQSIIDYIRPVQERYGVSMWTQT